MKAQVLTAAHKWGSYSPARCPGLILLGASELPALTSVTPRDLSSPRSSCTTLAPRCARHVPASACCSPCFHVTSHRHLHGLDSVVMFSLKCFLDHYIKNDLPPPFPRPIPVPCFTFLQSLYLHLTWHPFSDFLLWKCSNTQGHGKTKTVNSLTLTTQTQQLLMFCHIYFSSLLHAYFHWRGHKFSPLSGN